MRTVVPLILCVLVTVGCDSGPTEDESPPGDREPSRTLEPYTEGLRLGWDARTQLEVYGGNSSYPRMIRLDNGDLLVAYVHFVGEAIIQVQRSTDNGRTWSDPVVAVRDARTEVTANNPELIQLDNGTVLLPHGRRPQGEIGIPFELRVAASTDGGRSWDPRASVYKAGSSRRQGVWEPVIKQLPGGTLQLYAANEKPYVNSNDQEISMWRSSDRGRTWSDDFVTTSYREGARDGMPAPVLLQDGGGIVYAIESNQWSERCWQLKPTIIWTPSVNNAWSNAPVLGDDRRYRWRALASSARLNCNSRGTALYLVQFPTGETVLSFHTREDRERGGQTLVVAVGNQEARSFRHKARPFGVPDQEGHRAKWSSLFRKNDTTVTAVTSTSAYNGDRGGGFKQIYTVDGYRMGTWQVPSGAVTVDGDGSDPVWQKARGGILGAHSDKTTRVSAAWNEENLFLRYRVFDAQNVASEGLSDTDDAVLLALAPRALPNNTPSEGAFQLKVESDGDATVRRGMEGAWRPIDGASLRVAISEAESFQSVGFDGIKYVVEVGLEWDTVGGRPADGTGWGITAGIANNNTEGFQREWMSASDPDRPKTWFKATLVQ